jgi:hypothetical protein
MKKIIRIIVLTTLALYACFTSGYFLINNVHPTYKDCGIVRSKSADEVTIKHGTRTDLYLNVDFEKAGFKCVDVSRETYFNSFKGQKVCFDLSLDMPWWHTCFNFSGLFSIILIALFALISIVYYLVED